MIQTKKTDGSNIHCRLVMVIWERNVYGEIASEHLTFNEKTLWTGGPSESRKDYMGGNSTEKGQDGASLKNIQKLFAEGKTSEATAAVIICWLE